MNVSDKKAAKQRQMKKYFEVRYNTSLVVPRELEETFKGIPDTVGGRSWSDIVHACCLCPERAVEALKPIVAEFGAEQRSKTKRTMVEASSEIDRILKDSDDLSPEEQLAKIKELLAKGKQ